MAVVMDEKLKEKLRRVETRKWWPVAPLAEVLGKPKRYVYRRIEDGSFDVLNDGGFLKITTDSVIKYFFEDRV